MVRGEHKKDMLHVVDGVEEGGKGRMRNIRPDEELKSYMKGNKAGVLRQVRGECER